MNTFDLGYLCGIIDGEGHIGASKSGHSYTIRFNIYNTDEQLILWCKNKLNVGHVHLKHSNNQKHKNSWRLNITKQSDLAKVLSMIIPYLKVKKEQATLALEFVLSRLNKPPRGRGLGRPPYSKREVNIINKLYLLNKKGK